MMVFTAKQLIRGFTAHKCFASVWGQEFQPRLLTNGAFMAPFTVISEHLTIFGWVYFTDPKSFHSILGFEERGLCGPLRTNSPSEAYIVVAISNVRIVARTSHWFYVSRRYHKDIYVPPVWREMKEHLSHPKTLASHQHFRLAAPATYQPLASERVTVQLHSSRHSQRLPCLRPFSCW